MRKEFLTRLLVYVANFAFAIGILIVSCAWSGIYPFGDRSFLTEDLMFQYVDFFTWFQNVLLGEGSLFYSMSQALGNNTWGLYSYYLGSPLNFLIVFFEQGAITEFVFFVTALKIGFVQVATVFSSASDSDSRISYAPSSPLDSPGRAGRQPSFAIRNGSTSSSSFLWPHGACTGLSGASGGACSSLPLPWRLFAVGIRPTC